MFVCLNSAEAAKIKNSTAFFMFVVCLLHYFFFSFQEIHKRKRENEKQMWWPDFRDAHKYMRMQQDWILLINKNIDTHKQLVARINLFVFSVSFSISLVSFSFILPSVIDLLLSLMRSVFISYAAWIIEFRKTYNAINFNNVHLRHHNVISVVRKKNGD